jgi:hypothetical protein
MTNYPDWVLKHKKKGTYVNRVGDRYYLYAAHSERVPGTKKVRLVHDGYIGRITEEDGLIPARDKVAGEVAVYEYGLCMTLRSICDKILAGLRRGFRGAADRVFVAGLLAFAYGESGEEAYRRSYLSVAMPGLDMAKPLTDRQRTGAERCARMMADTAEKRFGGDRDEIFRRLEKIYMVEINGKLYLSKTSESAKEFLAGRGLDWRCGYGED